MKENQELSSNIRYTLLRLGFRSELSGFNYLCYAIERVVIDPSSGKCMCKGLYQQVKEHFGIQKLGKVERNMRNALEVLFLEENFLKLNELFHMNIFNINDKPSTSNFIHLLAEYFTLGIYTPLPQQTK